MPVTLIAPVLGMAEGALADFVDMVKGRATRGAVAGGNRRMAEFATIQSRVAEATGCIDAARLMMFRDLAETSATAARGEPTPLDMRLRNRLTHTFCTRLLVQAVDALFVAVGGQGILSGKAAAAGVARCACRRRSYQPQLGRGEHHVRPVRVGTGAKGTCHPGEP